MSKTSIHIKPCNVASSQIHNEREKELSYVRKDLSPLNESFLFDDRSLSAIVDDLKKEVKAKTGRKLQKNANPILEGVVVIDENTTMQQLQSYCAAVRQKFGLIPLQIHIHRDEGHVAAKEWKPNLHAHVVWRAYNAQGRNCRLSRADCSELQTMASEHLMMDRGMPSDQKHLNVLQYKIEAKRKEIAELENEQMSLAEKAGAVANGIVQGTKSVIEDMLHGNSKKRIKELEEENKKHKKTLLLAEKAFKKAKNEIKAKEDKIGQLEENKRELEAKIRETEYLRNENYELKKNKSRLEGINEAIEYGIPHKNLKELLSGSVSYVNMSIKRITGWWQLHVENGRLMAFAPSENIGNKYFIIDRAVELINKFPDRWKKLQEDIIGRIKQNIAQTRSRKR